MNRHFMGDAEDRNRPYRTARPPVSSYLVFIGWAAAGLLTVVLFGMYEESTSTGYEKFGSTVGMIVVLFAPCIAAGHLAGLGVVALIERAARPHPVLAGTLGYVCAVVLTLGFAAPYSLMLLM